MFYFYSSSIQTHLTLHTFKFSALYTTEYSQHAVLVLKSPQWLFPKLRGQGKPLQQLYPKPSSTRGSPHLGLVRTWTWFSTSGEAPEGLHSPGSPGQGGQVSPPPT